MIATTLKYNLIISFFLIGFQTNASVQPDQENRKLIQKTFEGTAGKILIIENKFGDIHVTNWDKNQIAIEVEIITEGRNEEQAIKIMNKIKVEIDESSGAISLKTRMDGLETNGSKESFEINYKVKLNPNNAVDFGNMFGDIYLPERIGETAIAIKYGSLKADYLKGNLELALTFGSADLLQLTNAELDLQYSNVDIGQVNQLDVEQKFSNLKVESVDEINLESKYGEANFGTIVKGVVEAHFSAFKIDYLVEYLDFEGNYVTGFEIKKLSSDFKSLTLVGQYTSYSVVLEEGLKADFEAEFSYSGLSHSGVNIDFYYQDIESNTKQYKGKINGGNSAKEIIVDSTYGNLKLKSSN